MEGILSQCHIQAEITEGITYESITGIGSNYKKTRKKQREKKMRETHPFSISSFSYLASLMPGDFFFLTMDISLTTGYLLLTLHQWNFFCHSFLDPKIIDSNQLHSPKLVKDSRPSRRNSKSIFSFFSINNEQRSNTNGREWSEQRRPENDTLGQEGSCYSFFSYF